MNAEQWRRVKPLLETAVSLAAVERAAFLDRACAGDPGLRKELESLLSSHERLDTSFLKAPAVDLTREIAPAVVRAGRKVGAYQIVEEIGHGGMGEVYRAFRADGHYSKEVAVKMVRGGADSASVQERFRNERQILASLDHPNIARLLDGGTTDDGVPYLVMELVEGMRIDTYCEKHRLTIPERLQLFRQVCSAVQYAHQHLVIHRDLKPSNILVTEDGVPKLLDFGIAKLLDEAAAGGGEFTLTGFQLLTPQYASPEQVRGESITTASDVYSLGVVLYELLTGHSPYQGHCADPPGTARAVCEVTPPRPSTAVLAAASGAGADHLGLPEKRAKQLQGDLDNIVLMALRKEPQRRYLSVEQLAEDIRRNLENLPVAARSDTAHYRARKFVARHKAGVAAFAAVAVVLMAGFVVTVRARRLAETRFNDVRSLANSLIFDVHDSIKDLPGSTPARKIIVDRSLQYLNVLAQQSSGDVGLQRELATAYEKVGSVQGDYLENNLGDNEGAMASYLKALAIRRQIDAGSNDLNDHLALAQVYRFVANQQWAMGDLKQARQNINHAIGISEGLNQTQLNNLNILLELGFDHRVSGAIRYAGDPLGNQKLDEDRRRSLAADESALHIQPDDLQILHAYALDLKNLAISLESTNPRGSLPYYQKALDINLKLTQRSREVRLRRSVAISYAEIADVYQDLGDFRQEVENNRKGLEIYQELSAADPKNALLRQGLAIAYVNTAAAISRNGDIVKSLEYDGKGLQLMRDLVASVPANTVQRNILAEMLVARGTVFIKASRPDAAIADLESARSIYEALYKPGEDRTLFASCEIKMGEAAARAARDQDAAEYFHQALRIVEPLIAHPDASLDGLYAAADAYSGLGRISLKKAQQKDQPVGQRKNNWTEARTWYTRSLNAWRRIDHPNRTAPNTFEVGDPAVVAQELRIAEAGLASLPPRKRRGEGLPR